MTNIARNATRVLRGFFVLRLITLALGAVIYTVRWSAFAPPESFETPTGLVVIALSTIVVTLFLFVPWRVKGFRR